MGRIPPDNADSRAFPSPRACSPARGGEGLLPDCFIFAARGSRLRGAFFCLRRAQQNSLYAVRWNLSFIEGVFTGACFFLPSRTVRGQTICDKPFIIHAITREAFNILADCGSTDFHTFFPRYERPLHGLWRIPV